MTDPIQILLVVVISILTLVLSIIGLEMFQILREFKKSLEKMNKILADTGRITEAVADPAVELSHFLLDLKQGLSGFTHGLTFIKKITSFFENRKEKHQEEQSPDNEEKTEENEAPKTILRKEKPSPIRKPRFFLKKGKSLGKV